MNDYTEESVSGEFAAGLWSGLVIVFLLASTVMVQIRSKIFGGFPSGDWPKDGYTWHFLPAFAVVALLWVAVAWYEGKVSGTSLTTALDAVGRAASPMLGMVVAWTWYGLTGPQFHAAGGCDVYLLCHDTGRGLILIWSSPWLLWGLWNVSRLFRSAHS